MRTTPPLPHLRHRAQLLVLGCVLTPLGMQRTLATTAQEPPACEDSAGCDAVDAQAQGFDLAILRQRNISVEIAESLRSGPRFSPGVTRVDVSVNGRRAGAADLTFKADGSICATASTLQQLGLKLPRGVEAQGGSCVPLHEALPGLQTQLDPAVNAVALVVAENQLRRDTTASHVSGGYAAIANYDLYASTTRTRAGASHQASLNGSIGFNAADWIVRSDHSGNWQGGRGSIRRQTIQAQRSIPKLRGNIQLGEISVANPLFAGTPIVGVQLQPEDSQPRAAAGAVITGIARGPARVEVQQHGRLLYSAMVEAGPFTLSQVPGSDRSADLSVVVHENDGSTHTITVPASAQGNAVVDSTPGVFVAAGRMRQNWTADADDKWVLSLGMQRQLARNRSIAVGALVSPDYRGLGVTGVRTFPGRGSVSIRQMISHDLRNDVRGTQLGLWWNQSLSKSLSLYIGSNWRSAGFRHQGEVGHDAEPDQAPARAEHQASLSLGWTSARSGVWRLGANQSRRQSGQSSLDVNAGWSGRIGPASLSASFSRRRSTVSGTASPRSSEAYVSLSVPLGHSSLRSSVRDTGLRRHISTSVSGRTDAGLQWDVGADRSGHGTGASARIGGPTPFGTGSLGYAHRGHSGTWTGGLRGGLVIDGKGVVRSPDRISDTFAVIDLPSLPGVKLRTPSTTVTTNRRGRAVAPSLSAWQQSTIEVISKTLPRDVTLQNGHRSVLAGRGAVLHMPFSAKRSQRILMRVTDPNGKAIEQGMGLFEDDGKDTQYVTTFVNGGLAYLDSFNPQARLIVRYGEGKRCRVIHEAEPTKGAAVSRINARCEEQVPGNMQSGNMQ